MQAEENYLPEAHDALMAVATEKLDTFRDRAKLRRLERNGPLARSVSRRAYAAYQEAGGEEGTGRPFLDWLVENWDEIFRMITMIVGLFSGVPAMAPAKAARKRKG